MIVPHSCSAFIIFRYNLNVFYSLVCLDNFFCCNCFVSFAESYFCYSSMGGFNWGHNGLPCQSILSNVKQPFIVLNLSLSLSVRVLACVYPVLGISLEHHLNYFTLDAFIAGDPRKRSVDVFGQTTHSMLMTINKLKKTMCGTLCSSSSRGLRGAGLATQARVNFLQFIRSLCCEADFTTVTLLWL